jgi:hypothetical protein
MNHVFRTATHGHVTRAKKLSSKYILTTFEHLAGYTSMAAASCSPAAYCTAAMHALKHPTQPVFGFLLGRRVTGDGAASSSAAAFADAAVPIMHTEVASAPHPVTSIALKQVVAVCRSTGRRVVGLYVANERLDDVTLHDHTTALIVHVANEISSNLTIWVLDNARLQPTPAAPKGSEGEPAVKLYSAERSAGSVRVSATSGRLAFATWNSDVLAPSGDIPAGTVVRKLSELLEARRFASVVDFEEHLEDCANDYFNPWAEQAAACA